jgi:hypothetical protein
MCSQDYGHVEGERFAVTLRRFYPGSLLDSSKDTKEEFEESVFLSFNFFVFLTFRPFAAKMKLSVSGMGDVILRE